MKKHLRIVLVLLAIFAAWYPLTTVAAPSPDAAITPGTARFSPTFNSIGIELPFGGDLDANAAVTVEFRRGSEITWRQGLPLWRTADSSGGAFYGSVMLLDPATQYRIRLTIADPGGVVGSRTQAMFVTTRPENIRAAHELAPTHFVRLDGSDTNAGTSNSPAGAWATIAKAIATAPAGAVVQVGSGSKTGDEFFPDSGLATGSPSSRATPITFVAPYPAIDDNGQPINVGRRTFIEGAVRAAPTGSNALPVVAPWTRVSLVGPTDGATRTVWKWSGAVPPDRTMTTLAYGSARASTFQRLWVWRSDTDRLATPAGWSELLYTNLTLRYGFYQAGADLYARLPGDADPNGFWWSGGVGPGISLNGPDSRVTGFVFRGLHFAVRSGPGSHRMVVDHNDFQTVTTALRGSATLPSGYATDMVFEHNYVRNTGLWSDNQASAPSAPWNFVKQRIKLANGSLYASTRIGGTMEGAAVIPVGSRRTVVRHNTIEGTFDGVGTVNVGDIAAEERFTNGEWDVHDNLLRKIADDPFEPARGAINWRIWNNRTEQTTTFLSTGGPTLWGPVYIWNNVAWRVGVGGLAANVDGTRTGATEGFHFKYDGAAIAGLQARIYVVNNTFWSDRPESVGGSPAAGQGGLPPAFYLRNNIFRGGNNGFEYFAGTNGRFDENFNQFLVASPSDGMLQVEPDIQYTSFGAYRSGSGQGTQSNLAIPDVHSIAMGDAQFVDPTSGKLALTAGSVLRTMGTLVPNIGATTGLGATP